MIYLALVHYPVLDRSGEVVTTAVTNLDIHDLARAGRTYGVRRYFVVTPIQAQRQLVERIVAHWRTGASAARIPERGDALSIVAIAPNLDAAIEDIRGDCGDAPHLVATAARAMPRATLSFEDARRALREDHRPWLILLGTGWGLADEVIRRADDLLPPIRGASDYNHLSVRAAAAVVLDRLLSV
ncbi:MAG: RNA methyltransferase [Deltaproteobacteria bacterium]|nr:RNA methyltransferase [Deltaproteobacteria bacterium]